LHRDWRHIGFARLLRTQAPTDAGAAAARGPLATGRSRKLDVCWISWPYDVTRARLLSDTCQRVRHCPAPAASGPPETDVDRFSPPPRPIGAQGRRVPSTRSMVEPSWITSHHSPTGHTDPHRIKLVGYYPLDSVNAPSAPALATPELPRRVAGRGMPLPHRCRH